jgi:hypothetical protein
MYLFNMFAVVGKQMQWSCVMIMKYAKSCRMLWCHRCTDLLLVSCWNIAHNVLLRQLTSSQSRTRRIDSNLMCFIGFKHQFIVPVVGFDALVNVHNPARTTSQDCADTCGNRYICWHCLSFLFEVNAPPFCDMTRIWS